MFPTNHALESSTYWSWCIIIKKKKKKKKKKKGLGAERACGNGLRDAFRSQKQVKTVPFFVVYNKVSYANSIRLRQMV